MKRSDFFKLALGAGLGLKSAFALAPEQKAVAALGALPRRALGKTGEKLSIIGFGGNIIKGETQETATPMARQAYEAGVNYFDVAPAYGNAEELMGPAIEPFRKNIFLSCKTGQRLKPDADSELERSLKRLHTDHFDLYQMHYLNTKADIDRAFGPGGAMETLAKAKEKGMTRFLGFSAHSVEAASAAMDLYDFDTVMFPINYVCIYQGGFGQQVVEKAAGKGMGILAIKPGVCCPRAGDGEDIYKKCWYRPFTVQEEVNRSYRFTLSLPVTSALPPQENALFWMAMKAGTSFTPVSETEKETLKKDSVSRQPLFRHPTWKG